MPELYMKKVAPHTYICDDDISEEYDKKVKVGKSVKVTMTVPRNYEFHKKFYAMVGLVVENQDRIPYATTKQGTDRMIYAVFYILKRGEFWGRNKEHFERQSISFANMDEMEFSQMYNEFLDVCLRHFVGGDKEDFERELIGFG